MVQPDRSNGETNTISSLSGKPTRQRILSQPAVQCHQQKGRFQRSYSQGAEDHHALITKISTIMSDTSVVDNNEDAFAPPPEDYKSYRRRSLVMDQMKLGDTHTFGGDVPLHEKLVRFREAQSSTDRIEEDPVAQIPRMQRSKGSTPDSAPSPNLVYRRGSRIEMSPPHLEAMLDSQVEADEGVKPKIETTNRFSDFHSSEFEQSLADYRKRELRRKSCHRLPHRIKEPGFKSEYKVMAVGCMIVMCLALVYAVSYWWRSGDRVS